MKEFKDLDDNAQKLLKQTIDTTQDLATVYMDFAKEGKDAVKKAQPKDSEAYLADHFDDVYSLAKKYGIGSGAFSISSVQQSLNDVVNNLKRIAVYPNSQLHQVIDDLVMIAEHYDHDPKTWVENTVNVNQDGKCLDADVGEIKRSFKMTDK
ncbi:hypothetical protein [Acetilactobacillus jinshanensis]|uniref:Uncharacterized protein n=1 Tax=Acetilactobacillus jinshanensis TaxID=1720083 RepID=A0A4P6ZJD5_9LACO|nr:hypothetical protein [Acetilactobacillus jinshanensis]QBP17766.1 hypothetical protein ELX58_00940 [Acetilactobacillus jinshanensis]URL60628.1 hypothetical protein HGK75_00965 [uncultured bacterium]